MIQNLNNNVRKVKPSATLVINELSAQLKREGREIYSLGFGQSPFPVPESIVKSLQENAFQKDYLPVKGLLQLRMAVAQFFNKQYELSVSEEDILIGPGSKELIYNFQLVYNIEELLLPSPSWVSYEPQASLLGNKVKWITTNELNSWKISSDDIEEICKNSPKINRTIILNYPSNPLGVTYSSGELQKLTNVFKKYNITVIADEIYGEIHHDGDHQTIAKYYPERTIVSSGLSKWAGAGGWRLGVFVFPENMRYVLDAMGTVASETYTTTSAPIQYAAVTAYNGDESINLYLKNVRSILKTVGQFVYKKLMGIGVTMPEPEGGFYLFPNFNNWKVALNKRRINSSKEFCNQLLKDTGVALLPGEDFGHPSNNLTARLSFVDFDGGHLLNIIKDNDSLHLNDEFVELHCPKISESIVKIKNWLESY